MGSSSGLSGLQHVIDAATTKALGIDERKEYTLWSDPTLIEHLLPEEFRTKTIETLRWSLIGIAGKVVRHGRRLWLLLATTWDKLSLYHRMRKGCMAFG